MGDRVIKFMLMFFLNQVYVLLYISNMISESIWKKQQSMLQEQASNISILKKQITKEAEIDASVQLSIAQKIQNLKQNATLLAKKLQNEKHKNSELETIIDHIKNKMEKQKLEEASFRDNINSESLASLDNRFKKLQYDLGQINSKVNRLSENVELKRSKITQNRTERVIDSGIFRNIEKELIDSQLTFKKLLIQKIRYQKEYQKLIEEYSSLKEKAEVYAQRDSAKLKSSTQVSALSTVQEDPSMQYKRKFLEMQMGRSKDRCPTSSKFGDEIDLQQQRNVVCVQKMLSQTRLQTVGELVELFEHIDEINERYFNEMNNYADQSNQIERYLSAVEVGRKERMHRFYPEQRELSKQQLSTIECKEMRKRLKKQSEEVDGEMHEFVDLFESDGFKKFLKELEIEDVSIGEGGQVNFDLITQTLQLLQKNIQQFMHQSNQIELDKNGSGKGNGGGEKLQEMINRVKKNEECLKVMKKQDFQQEYHKIVKNMSQKVVVTRSLAKKKSFGSFKK